MENELITSGLNYEEVQLFNYRNMAPTASCTLCRTCGPQLEVFAALHPAFTIRANYPEQIEQVSGLLVHKDKNPIEN